MKGTIRLLQQLHLYEVSCVLFPANVNAIVQAKGKIEYDTKYEYVTGDTQRSAIVQKQVNAHKGYYTNELADLFGVDKNAMNAIIVKARQQGDIDAKRAPNGWIVEGRYLARLSTLYRDDLAQAAIASNNYKAIQVSVYDSTLDSNTIPYNKAVINSLPQSKRSDEYDGRGIIRADED
jgi:hypothetical protein